MWVMKANKVEMRKKLQTSFHLMPVFKKVKLQETKDIITYVKCLPILEFCSVLWNPLQIGHIESLCPETIFM